MSNAPQAPIAPARITAIDSEGGHAPAIGARRIGIFKPNRSQNAAARPRGSSIISELTLMCGSHPQPSRQVKFRRFPDGCGAQREPPRYNPAVFGYPFSVIFQVGRYNTHVRIIWAVA